MSGGSAGPLCDLHGVDVELGGIRVLSGLRWTLRRGEHWRLCGPNGSGKTTFLRLVRGDVAPAPGQWNRRTYALDGEPSASPLSAEGRMALVGPALQEKFQQIDRALPCMEVVATGFHGTVYRQQVLEDPQRERLAEMAGRAAVRPLRNRIFQECSQGQQRVILLARALIGKPDVVLLDEFSDGLDREARAGLASLLEQAAKDGATLVAAAHTANGAPEWIDRTLAFRNGTARPAARARVPAPRDRRRGARRFRTGTSGSERAAGEPWIRAERLSVYLRDTRALDRVSWTLRPGEAWALTGPNGSGKTTLLRTFAGELDPDGDSVLIRFGEPHLGRRELQRRVRLFYPAMVSMFDPEEIVIDTLRSGFNGCVGRYPRLDAGKRSLLKEASDRFSVGHLWTRPLYELSHGETRRVFLVRALVGDPDVLLLDEPFDGLDPHGRRALDGILQARRTGVVVVATHEPQALPPRIDRLYHLPGRS